VEKGRIRTMQAIAIAVGAAINFNPSVKIDSEQKSKLALQAKLDVEQAVRKALADYEGCVEIDVDSIFEG